MEITCMFPPGTSTPDHVVLAESLGYRRAWCYDSPVFYGDPWSTLARAAERTSTIGLGTAVVVPSLRHVMVTASCITTLADLAPGRVAVALGSGFSGRMGLGHRPMRWRDVEAYVVALKSLLRGEVVEWDQRLITLQQPPGFGARLPLDIPLLVAADGPKGFAVARAHGDGVFFGGNPQCAAVPEIGWQALIAFGTVLEDGEDALSERARTTVASQLAEIYHVTYEFGGAAAVDPLPGGREWREGVERIPARERHLVMHRGHLVEANEHDDPILRNGAGQATSLMWVGSRAELRDRAAALADLGITELAFQPSGPDIARELRTFREIVA